MASSHEMSVLTLSCALAWGTLAGNFQWNTSVAEGFVDAGTSWNGGTFTMPSTFGGRRPMVRVDASRQLLDALRFQHSGQVCLVVAQGRGDHWRHGGF